MEDIKNIVVAQHKYFNTNSTKNIDFRLEQLKKVKHIIQSNENLLYEAIKADFMKSEFETYVSELSLLYHEIDTFISSLRKWSKRQKVSTGLINFPAKSYIIPEPLGVTLIIGAWNYPYQLSLVPAISSLAAGNTVVLKPSELPEHTSRVMAKLINENFSKDYFHVIEGGINETTTLLEQSFDKIFFTGSTPVGRIVYQAAAKNLTPVTLELGGKSPTFVLADADIAMTAKRLVWAKFINAGQTCVAPDYILVDKRIEAQLIDAMKLELQKYPKSFKEMNDNYVQIINVRNFDRVSQLIDKNKVCYGGLIDRENRFISPTIMNNISFDDKIMEDEIFGPILPVLSFTNLDEVIEKVKERQKPLACYVYSNSKAKIDKILNEVSFGGGAINDSIMHLTNNKLPFGGVGHSGFGSYHGKAGFDTFTHYKSILHRSNWYESNLKYSPYSLKKLKWIKRLLN